MQPPPLPAFVEARINDRFDTLERRLDDVLAAVAAQNRCVVQVLDLVRVSVFSTGALAHKRALFQVSRLSPKDAPILEHLLQQMKANSAVLGVIAAPSVPPATTSKNEKLTVDAATQRKRKLRAERNVAAADREPKLPKRH